VLGDFGGLRLRGVTKVLECIIEKAARILRCLRKTRVTGETDNCAENGGNPKKTEALENSESPEKWTHVLNSTKEGLLLGGREPPKKPGRVEKTPQCKMAKVAS